MRSLIAALWQLEFTWRLSRKAGTRVSRGMLRRTIKRLPDGNMPGSDRAREFNLTLARSLHAAVIFLECDLGLAHEEAFLRARTAFIETGNWLARAGVRLWLRVERDPFAGVRARGPSAFAKAVWGNGIAVEDRHTQDTVSLCVLTCPFHEYFWNVGRTDLTPILCAWDTAWQAEVNRSGKPIRVDIPGTLATNGDQCEFTFRRAVGSNRRT